MIKGVTPGNTHSLLMRIQNDTLTLENNLAVFTKLNIDLPFNYIITLLGVYPTNLKTCSQKISTWIFIAGLLIIIKNWKKTKMYFNRWMDKQTVVHLYNAILFSDKQECIINPHKNMDES